MIVKLCIFFFALSLNPKNQTIEAIKMIFCFSKLKNLENSSVSHVFACLHATMSLKLHFFLFLVINLEFFIRNEQQAASLFI